MDTLSYTPEEFVLDDELDQQLTFLDPGYQNIGYTDNVARQFSGSGFDETSIVASTPLLFEGVNSTAESNLIDPSPFYHQFVAQGLDTANFVYPPFTGFSDITYLPMSFAEPYEHSCPISEPIITPQNREPAVVEKEAKQVTASQETSSVSKTLNLIPASNHIDIEEKLPLKTNVCALKTSGGPPQSLLTVFDSNIEPRKRHKFRKQFTEEGKKKVEAVRSVGACIQCRFRKRTCGTNRPCQSCIRRTGSRDLAATICTRNSPFENISVTQFYGSACRQRVVDFNIDFSKVEGRRRVIALDGKGVIRRPIQIIVLDVDTRSLDADAQKEIARVHNLSSHSPIQESTAAPEVVTILDPDVLSTIDLENWALDYAYRFTVGHNQHAKTFIMAVKWVERKLPHSDLVGRMVKLIAIHYAIYHGVKFTSNDSSKDTRMRTLHAQIDTKLFQILHHSEAFVYQELQRLVFKASGNLARDAVVPVCLVLWLLIRLQCLRASYIANIRPKKYNPKPVVNSRGEATTSAEHQDHSLNLLLGTFTALFRSSLPLIFDFEDQFNRDLFGGDDELRKMGEEVRGCLLWFKKFGYIRHHKKSLGYSRVHTLKILDVIKV